VEIPEFAWGPAPPIARFPYYAESPLGQPELRFVTAQGGYAIIDMYACAAITGLVSVAEFEGEIDFAESHCNELAQRAWRLAAAMARNRPPKPEIPPSGQNSKPRLVKP